MSIQNWPEEERPREKLLAKGAAALADSELLAIFLRVGVAGMSAVALSDHLLKHFGSLANLYQATLSDFSAIKGIGPAKYVQLQATLELAKRVLGSQTAEAPISVAQIQEYIQLILQPLTHEECWVFYLDDQRKLIASECIARGDAAHATFCKKKFTQKLLMHTAPIHAAILAHNHPKSTAKPSFSDIKTTQEIFKLLSLFDIQLLDHLIIGAGSIFSMHEHQLF
jgi:DNA repair protein RadC